MSESVYLIKVFININILLYLLNTRDGGEEKGMRNKRTTCRRIANPQNAHISLSLIKLFVVYATIDD